MRLRCVSPVVAKHLLSMQRASGKKRKGREGQDGGRTWLPLLSDLPFYLTTPACVHVMPGDRTVLKEIVNQVRFLFQTHPQV